MSILPKNIANKDVVGCRWCIGDDRLEFVVNLSADNCARGCCGTSTSSGYGDTIEEAVDNAVRNLGNEYMREPTYDVYLRTPRLEDGVRELIQASQRKIKDEYAASELEQEKKNQTRYYAKAISAIMDDYKKAITELKAGKDNYTKKGYTLKREVINASKNEDIEAIKLEYPLASGTDSHE